MKRITFALYLCTALIACTLLETKAATHIVLPGASIQAKINLAVAGDTIIIKGGTYAGEALTISKLLDIRPEQGASVIISEGITLQDLNGTFNFANLRIGANNTKNLTINNCTKVYLDNLNLSTSGGGLDIDNNSTVQVNNCTFGNLSTVDANCTIYAANSTFKAITLNNSKITLRKCTLQGHVNANKTRLVLLKCNTNGYDINVPHETDDYGRSIDFTALQNTLLSSRMKANAKRNWVAYNTLDVGGGTTGGSHSSVLDMKGESYAIGNIITHEPQRHSSYSSNGIYLDQASGDKAYIYNNIIFCSHEQHGRIHSSNGIYVYDGNATIVNNVISGWRQRYDHSSSGNGIFQRQRNGTSGLKIHGNMFWFNEEQTGGGVGNEYGYAIVATAQGVVSSHNLFNTQDGSGLAGGVTDTDSTTIAGSPFVTWPGWEKRYISYTFDFHLSNSGQGLLAQDKGPPQAQYNDYGGTRNNPGAYGGHKYDPTGMTTTKPIVLTVIVNPTQLLKGTDTTITIKSRGGIVTP